MVKLDEPVSEYTDRIRHLLIEPDARCWWCKSQPATTGEHKFKRTDLVRLMSHDSLIWGDGYGNLKQIRGKSGVTRDRHGVIKFPKSMCANCNNVRSQPFDFAYDKYSEYVNGHLLRIMPGISFTEIFGDDWQRSTLDLARYYAKHFGCRMVRTGLPVPQSLRDFLDGADDMPDAHMVLVATDSQRHLDRRSLSVSGDFVWVDKEGTKFRGYVLCAYIGAIGVRYEWTEDRIPDESRS